MTGNQIEYWKLQEGKRHNIVTEKESERHNVAGEKETYRHNFATEGETNRHNRQTEQVDLGNLQESVRHNKTTEQESNRHNLETERQGRDVISETNRHNLETERQGRDVIAETGRHNRVTEGIDIGRLNESVRHNVASENIDLSKLQETARHNAASERVDTGRLNVEQERQDVEATRAQYQNVLTESQAKLNELEADWVGLEHSAHVNLTQSQRKQYDGYVDKIQTEIEKLKQDINTGRADEALKEATTLNEFLKSLGTLIDGIIPG